MSGHLFVVSGPSGAGKGTLVSEVMRRLDRLALSLSATTRPPRAGETDGVEYRFLSDGQFDELAANGGLVEWAEVHGHRYGTLRSHIEEGLASGWDIVLEIDYQGALAIRRLFADAKLVFIDAPSFEALTERLKARGSETGETLARRLQTAQVELAHRHCYDAVIVNDDLQDAADALAAFIEGVRLEGGDAIGEELKRPLCHKGQESNRSE
jgi:guanylate kinase